MSNNEEKIINLDITTVMGKHIRENNKKIQ